MEYQCPYCKKSKSLKGKKYDSWRSVRIHLKHCVEKTGEYFISMLTGPVHYTEILNTPLPILREKFGLTLSEINKTFKERKIYDIDIFAPYTEQDCLNAIKAFYALHGYVPSTKSYYRVNKTYPCERTIINVVGSWNEAIIKAGFEVNKSIFANPTIGKDLYKYRSQAEAYFADNFLFGKYDYIIEPKYPPVYNKIYDWFIPSLNIYIELDGGIRPAVVDEKRKINIELARTCLFIKAPYIYYKTSLQDFINEN
jgi:hypothetical protein